MRLPPFPYLLAGLLLLAAILRLLFLGHENLWLDEINTLLVATVHGYPQQIAPEARTVSEWFHQHLAWQPMNPDILMAMLRQNVHMPLYYLLLNPWLGVFGLSEESVRGFSALFSWLMLIPIYFLGKAIGKISGREEKAHWFGFWAVLVAALSPFQLYYAQEARMYTLAMFCSGLSGLALWKIFYGGAGRVRLWSVVYAVAVLAGSFTHYVFLFQLPFHALFGGTLIFRKPEKRHLAVLPAVILVLVAAWLWHPVYLAQKTGILDHGDHFSDGLLKPLRYLGALGYEPLVVVSGNENLAQFFYIPVTVLLFLCWLWQGRRNGWRYGHHGFLAMWITVPLIAQIGVDWAQKTHTVTIVRYTMLIAPGVYLLLGSALAGMSGQPFSQRFRAALAVAMLLIAVSTVWPGTPFRYREKFATADNAGYLAETVRPGDVIVVNGPLGAPATLAYYLKDTLPDQPILYWVREYNGQPVPCPGPELPGQFSRAWLFMYRGGQKRGAYDLMDALDRHYPRKDTLLGPRKRLTLYYQEP